MSDFQKEFGDVALSEAPVVDTPSEGTSTPPATNSPVTPEPVRLPLPPMGVYSVKVGGVAIEEVQRPVFINDEHGKAQKVEGKTRQGHKIRFKFDYTDPTLAEKYANLYHTATVNENITWFAPVEKEDGKTEFVFTIHPKLAGMFKAMFGSSIPKVKMSVHDVDLAYAHGCYASVFAKPEEYIKEDGTKVLYADLTFAPTESLEQLTFNSNRKNGMFEAAVLADEIRKAERMANNPSVGNWKVIAAK